MCEDDHEHCEAWADKGFCKENHPAYMKLHCKASCGLCEGKCQFRISEF